MNVFEKDRKALVVCGTPGQDMSKIKRHNIGASWLFEHSKASFVCVSGKWKMEWDKLDVPVFSVFFSNQRGGSLETNERSEEHVGKAGSCQVYERGHIQKLSVMSWNGSMRVPLDRIPLWHVRPCNPAAFEHLFVYKMTRDKTFCIARST